MITEEKDEKIEEIVQKQSDQFDKYIVTLAAALFGGSAVYLKDIVGLVPTGIWILSTSWIFLGFCIASTLLSFQMSQIAMRQYKDQLRGIRAKEINKWPQHLNWISYGSLLLGAGFFGVFVITNLK